jgi:hypothetical protein
MEPETRNASIRLQRLPELSRQLEESGVGVVCLTRENLTAP